MSSSEFELTKHFIPLTPGELRAHSVPEPWLYGVGFRATFGDLDAQNHVSNVKYLRWIEAFRVSYLRDYGWPEYATPSARPMVIRRYEIDYLKPAHLGDDIIVTGRTTTVRNTSCVMQYAIWRGEMIASATAVLVFLDHEGRKTPLPKDLRFGMIAQDGAKSDTA